VYRRVLPTTNLRFLSTVMWDGRETVRPLTDRRIFPANLRAGLLHQAMDATLGHAQAAVTPSASQLGSIVDFELALFTAQQTDDAAGVLKAERGNGGPAALVSASYFPGINDPLGDNPTGAEFDPTAFTLFESWKSLGSSGRYTAARKAVARGQTVFNTHPLAITGVAGLNDALGVSSINGTCTTCHDSPNVGHHSRPLPLDIGVSHLRTYESDPQVIAALGQLSTPDLPVFRVECQSGLLAGTVRYTSDPGRGVDLGKVRGHRPAQGPYPPGPRGAGAVLSQRLRRDAQAGGGLLQPAIPDGADGPGEGRSGGVPQDVVGGWWIRSHPEAYSPVGYVSGNSPVCHPDVMSSGSTAAVRSRWITASNCSGSRASK
jgi:cytochrome c peroxidase